MQTLEEILRFYFRMVNLLDVHLKERMLIENKLPVDSISYHSIQLVVHELLIEFLSDIIGSFQFLAILIIQKL